MAYLDLPDLTREILAELGGWTVLRQGRNLFKTGAVTAVEWSHPLLSGTVMDAGEAMEVELDLRSLTFIKNRCPCRVGRGGQVCPHAIALCLAIREKAETAHRAPAPAPAPREAPVGKARQKGAVPDPAREGLRTLKLDPGGQPLRLVLVLPPNLEAAAERNAVVLKMEFLLGGERISPEKLFKGASYAVPEPVREILAFLEGVCGGGLFSLVQVKREQLRFLVEKGTGWVEFLDTRKGTQPMDEGALRKDLIPILTKEGEEPAPVEVRRSREVRGAAPSRQAPAVDRPVLPDNWMVIDGSTQYLSILLREREHPQYQRCADWLRAEGFRKEPSNGKWWLRDPHKVLNFLALNRARLERDYDPGYTENFRLRTAAVEPVEVACQTVGEGNAFTLRLELKAEGLELAEVRQALVSGRHYILQEDRVFLLTKETIEQFETISRTLGGDPDLPLTGLFQGRLTGADLPHVDAVLEDMEIEAVLPEDWKERSAAIRKVGQLKPPPLTEAIRARFRGYQLIGTAWLWHLYRNQLGGILADEMGLGKTIQAIGLLLCWKDHGEREGPALVVAPASLIGNWGRELSVWAPGLSVYVHHGASRRTDFEADDFQPDVCLTSYSTLRNDQALFQSISFSLALADEAQHVKNRRSHAAKSLRSIAARSRYVLTGTPIENSIEDLRALFDFCQPGYLKRPRGDLRGEERQWHEQRDLEKAAPFILRRGKKLVAPELPEKIEQTLWCGMEARQQDLYLEVRRKTEETLMKMAAAGASENRLRFTILTELLRLRQICADPGLLHPDYPIEESAKFGLFQEILQEAIDGNHRILVFSQFVKLLKRLRGWLEANEISTAYIDGSTRDRLAVCDRFNRDESLTLCLISLKAGGTGLNLTGADTVVHFDPWWNPAVEDQATDRAHRIGQSRTVTSYKLVTEGTVEDKVLALQIRKSALLKELLEESAIHSAKVDLSTLKSLLS